MHLGKYITCCMLLLGLSLQAEQLVMYDCVQRAGGIVKVKKVSAFAYNLTAVPNHGYSFLYWSDGVEDSIRVYAHTPGDETIYTFHAVFAKDGDIHLAGGDVEVTIDNPSIPSYFLEEHVAEDATFKYWNNGATTTKISYSETEGNRVPLFVMNQGSLCWSFDPHNGGRIVVTKESQWTSWIEAVPNEGYSFLSWLDGNTTNPRQYTHNQDPTKDSTIYAVFTKDEDVIRNHGHVTVAIPDHSQLEYRLSAIADPDASLIGWNNGSSAPEQSYVESDGTRVPFFAANVGELTFKYINHAGGHIEGEVLNDMTAQVTAVPADGYEFLSWIDGDKTNPRVYTHVKDATKDSTLLAVFTKIEDVNRPHGHVDVAITNRQTPSFQLTAKPEGEAHLHCWNNGSAEITQSYVEADNTRIPFFVDPTGQMTIILEQHEGGFVRAEHESSWTYWLYATPKEDYTFYGWSDGIKDNPRKYVHSPSLSADKTFYAVFTNDFDITQSGGTTVVAVTDANTPAFNLTANPGECSEFQAWNAGGNVLTIPYLESYGQRIPIYSHGDHKVLCDKEDHMGGTILVQPVECGFTLTPIANPGFGFIKWEDESTTPVRHVGYVAQKYTAYFSACVAMVGNEAYATVKDAITAADGRPIILLTNTKENVEVTTPITLDGRGKAIGNMNILCGGSVTMTGNLTVDSLFMNTTTGGSAQLIHAEKLNYSEAFLDIRLEASLPTATSGKWYAVSVPFEVEVANDIVRKAGPSTHQPGVDYLVWEYDGYLRASTGNGWKQMLQGRMQPGRFYMFGISGTQNIWRFKKAHDAAMGGNTSVSMLQYPSNIIDRGWNAVGNPLIQYANASIPEIPFVQVYDNAHSRYLVKLLSQTSFVVGCPFFAQVLENTTMTIVASSQTNPGSLYAPKRATTDNLCQYEVRFGQDIDFDAVFVSSSDYSTTSYEVGKDVMKLGLSTSSPSVWLTGYGNMLCVQDLPKDNGAATYKLSLLAPSNGLYTLAIDESSKEGTLPLYLLKDGVIIWNLTDTPYEVNLARGLYSNYSLQIGVQSSIPTNSPKVDFNQQPTKLIWNEHLFIRLEGKMYNAIGEEIR